MTLPQGLLTSRLPRQSLLTSRLPRQSLLTSRLPRQSLLTSRLPRQSLWGLPMSWPPCPLPRLRWPPRPSPLPRKPPRLSLAKSLLSPRFPQGIFFGGAIIPADVELGPRWRKLIASVMDLPLLLMRAAGIRVASALSSPAILEVLPPSTALPVMGVAILHVWDAHCTPETSPFHKSAPEASLVQESASPVLSCPWSQRPLMNSRSVLSWSRGPSMNSQSVLSRPRRSFLNSRSVLSQPLRPLLCLLRHGPLLCHGSLLCLFRHGSLLCLFHHFPMLQACLCSTIQVLFPFAGLALHPSPVLPLLLHPPGLFGFCFWFCLDIRSRP